MPERWERELGKLTFVDAPPSTRARVTAGPRGDGMPSAPRRGQRLLAGVVAFAVFGAALALAGGVLGRIGSTTPIASTALRPGLTIELYGDDSGPSAALRYGDAAAQPQVGSYCWSGHGVGTCADTALETFPPGAFVDVPVGTAITVQADDGLTSVTSTLEQGRDPRVVLSRTTLMNPVSSIDGEAGHHYVLTVSASWPQGSVRFFFPIEVTGTASPAPPTSSAGTLVATLRVPADGSMPPLSLTYEDRAARFDAQDGRWPGVTLSPIPLQVFDPHIEPGATLAIAGNARRVEGSLWIADGHQNLTGESIALDLSSGSADLPDRPGFYRLTLAGTWPLGEAGFSVAITIGSPSVDAPPPSPPIVVVPNVIGLDVHDAVTRLKEAGFVSTAVASPANSATGVVASSDPPAGTSTEMTTTIKLTVSASR